MDSPGSRPADIIPENSIFTRERRRAVRHRVHTPAYANLNGSSQGAVLELCEILDISEGGMCIQASSTMKVNRLLPLCLDLSETGTRIHTTGHVVWSDQSGKTGIRFPEMPEASRAQLQQWLTANAAVGSAAKAAGKEEHDASSRPVQSRPTSASGYSSLIHEWAEIEKEAELFGPDMEPALQMIVQRALTLTWASGAAVALMNKLKPSELICRARAGTDSPELGARLQAGAGFSGECVRAAATLKCDDAQTDSRVDRKSCRALGIRSLIACPIKRRSGEVIGILEVFSPETAAFWDNDSTVLERLARIVATVVGHAERTRPDVLAFRRPPDEPEPNLLADTLRSFEDQEFAARAASFGRKVLLLVTGIAAVYATIWLVTPWIADSITKFASRSGAQSAEASPLRDTYVGASVKDLRRHALKGDAAAEYTLGIRYASGEGVKQDYHEAVGWFLKAADRGDLRAAAKIATCYWAGKGAPRDYSKAYFWALLAQAGQDEEDEKTGRTIVIQSAPNLSHAQTVAEQQDANKWLRAHHISSDSFPETAQ